MKIQQALIHGGPLRCRQFPRVMPENPRGPAKLGKRALKLLLIHAFIVPLLAQDASPKLTAWKWSLAALVAASAADTVTAWGKVETNPLLGERYGGRALTIKAGSTIGLIVVEWRYRKRAPRMFTVLNLAAAGALTVIAAHNWQVAQGQSCPR